MPPDTETTTPLAIPDEAVARLHVCDADTHLHDRAYSCVQAISAPVVAAELRRIAEEGFWSDEQAAFVVSADDLRARADQLDNATG